MADTFKASAQGLQVVDRARIRSGWTRTRSLEWWAQAHTSQATLKRFWRGLPIQQDAFVAICQAVGIANWQDIRLQEAVEAGEPDAPEAHQAIVLDTALEQTAHPDWPVQDWQGAPDINEFYGRATELATLEQWIGADRSKVVLVFGLGGIGKTSLAVAVADQLQTQFEGVIWRSLPLFSSFGELMAGLLSRLAPEQDLEPTPQAQLSQLVACLHQHRCLLVLDEIEEWVRPPRAQAARDRPMRPDDDLELFAQLLQRLAQERHQSCVLLTSRDQPEALSLVSPSRSLQLQGLDPTAAQALLVARGFAASLPGLPELVEMYRGNPLALKVIATLIQDLFNGNIAAFLSQNTLVLSDRLRGLVRSQVSDLTPQQRSVVNGLAIAALPLPLPELLTNFPLPPPSELMQVLVDLERRSLLEKTITSQGDVSFTLQPLVLKFVVETLLEALLDQLDTALETQTLEPLVLLSTTPLVGSSGSHRFLQRLQRHLWRAFQGEAQGRQVLATVMEWQGRILSLTDAPNLDLLSRNLAALARSSPAEF
jgi:NB-ARC domain